MLAFAAGVGAGVLTAVAMRLVESSPLASGPLARYTNGTLLVGIAGSALAIYAAWCWVLRTGHPHRDLAWSVAGLYLGVGAGVQPPLPGAFFAGLLFVLPTAAVAYLVQWTLSQPDVAASAIVLTLIGVAGLVMATLLGFMLVPPPVGTAGFVVGPLVVAGSRSTTRAAVGLGALLVGVLLTAGVAIPLILIG